MADRTHDDEDKLTRDVKTPAGSYQEGRVDSVGGGPSGSDRDDRTAEGQGRGISRREEGRAPDEFISSEVNEKTSRPMHPDKTRG
jgi:hypothetical protein